MGLAPLAPGGPAGFGYALLLTGAGAAVLTAARRAAAGVGQEAVIGVLYVVAAAATVLVVDRSPQGAEHVKRMLVGDILAIGPGEVLRRVSLPAAALRRRAVLRRASLTAYGRSATLLIGTLDPGGAFALTVTAAVAAPVVLRLPALPGADALAARVLVEATEARVKVGAAGWATALDAEAEARRARLFRTQYRAVESEVVGLAVKW